MAKIILIVSIVAMGGATFFGIKNRQELISLKKEAIAINGRIDSAWTRSLDTVDDINKNKGELEAEQEGQAEVTASISARRRDVAQLESSITKADEEIAEVQARVDALQAELDSLGVTPDTLLAQKDQLEKDIVIAGEEAETLTGEIDLTRNVIANNRQAAASIQERLAQRKRAIAANQLTVSVRDVNDEYGFVVLNAGKTGGVSGDSQFLILRGGTLIAKVSASSVQDGITVANVIPGSLAQGAVIMPGDTAILDTK